MERGELLNRLRKFYAKLAVQLEEKEVPLQRTREARRGHRELEREQTAHSAIGSSISRRRST